MAQQTVTDDDAQPTDYEDARESMMTTKGVERSTLDIGDDEHALSDMDSKRQAPVEAVAKNVVNRYDEVQAFLREYLANSHTACIQRARYELREAGVEADFADVRDVIETARDEVGYEPVIRVVRNHNPEQFALKIIDNGIGVPSDTALAIRDIGLSGWHDDEFSNGQFGQGTMSGFLPVDYYGEFDMTTHAVETEENYRVRWKLTDLDSLPGGRESYGTTFTWPYFTDEAMDIDTYDAVREYAEGMIVPVIYEHYDEDGTKNGDISDDWAGSYIEDRYSDESPLIVAEDAYAKAVWSPDDPEGWSTNIKTWCGYQPIDRNDPGYSINAYSMPSAFDIRVKIEDGSIVHVPEDATVPGYDDPTAIEGLVPVSENKYEHLPENQMDGHVPRSTVPDEAVIAPEPTDDRDRFESKHVDSFMRHYAAQLETQFQERVGEILSGLDGLESLPDMDDADRQLLLSGIDQYVSVYASNDAERLQDDIESVFGVRPSPTLALNIGVVKREFGSSVSDDFARAVGRLKQTQIGADKAQADTAAEYFENTVSGMTQQMSFVPRGSTRFTKQSQRSYEPVWSIVDAAGADGTVYMAKSIGATQKAHLAWELHEDNQVVVVDGYERWAETYGWEKLKTLPSRGFASAFPDHDFDEDFLDSYDPEYGATTGAQSQASSGKDLSDFGFDVERAKRRSVKIRSGSGDPSSFTTYTGQAIHDRLSDRCDDSVILAGKVVTTLVLYRQTEGHRADAGESLTDLEYDNTAYAVVPEYVYEYLIECDSVVTPEQYRQLQRRQWVEFTWSSGHRTGAEFRNLDETDVFLARDSKLFEPIRERGCWDEFAEQLADTLGHSVDSITLVSTDDEKDYVTQLRRNSAIEFDERPTLCGSDSNRPFRNEGFTHLDHYLDYVSGSVNVDSLYFDAVLGDLDHETDEWSYFNPDMDEHDLIDALQTLADNGGFVSTDDTTLPAHVGDEDYMIDESRYYTEQTVARFNDVTDYFDDGSGDA